MFNFFKKQAIINRVNDEILYEYVLEELEDNVKKKGLWAKAYANSDGDESKIEPLYMQYRVQSIKDAFSAVEIMYSDLSRKSLFNLIKSNFKNVDSIDIKAEGLRWKRDGEIVTDTETGLMWQDNAEVKELKMNWDEAHVYAEHLALGEYVDWRLPTKEELLRIVDKNRKTFAIYVEFKNIKSYYYWSSTTNTSGSKGAWSVDFFNGYQSNRNKSASNHVRCVRAG